MPAMKMLAATAKSAQRKGRRVAHLVEQAQRPPAIRGNKGDRPPGQVGRMFKSAPSSRSRWTASRRRSSRAVCSGSIRRADLARRAP